ncbi:basic helix-loop-helix protein [Stygiomarasmius scandens]|uniref:Basic helix-loop-helix protein n=1 Tax=Marasmiellus scandens TaxID=2682957 RepID=A0ABR1J3A1_9AGAR
MAPSDPQPTVSNPPQAPPAAGVPPTPGVPLSELPLDRTQIMQLLAHIPGIFTKVTTPEGTLKEDAAQILSNLSQQQNFAGLVGTAAAAAAAAGQGHPPPPPHGLPHGVPPPGAPGFGPMDPGPSSHPRGPPNLGQLSAAVAMQAGAPPPPATGGGGGLSDGEGDDGSDATPVPAAAPASGGSTGGGRRGGRGGGAAMGSDEWTRQRKDNHKEVERRRRGNINEGINELGRIVPNGSGEKSKGAILSRAVQYIHHLKENEARNIEKWTLEKLLMDQAMGDLQAQLEETRRAWEEERQGREKAEREVQELLKKQVGGAGTKRASEDGEAGKEEDGNKRQRTE